MFLRLYKRAGLVALVVAGLALFGASGARAQGIPVYDNTSFIELVQQVEQGAQQLAQLRQQLQAQLQMLHSLPSTIMPGLGQLASSTQQLMGQIQNIRNMGSNLTGELSGLYPTSFGSRNPQAILSQIASMTSANRQAIATSMQIQNQVATAQPQVASEVASAVSASQAAPGPTAVAQATNQILAAQSAQLGQLQSILIADERSNEQQQLHQQSEQAAVSAFNDQPGIVAAAQTFNGGY